MKKKKSKIDLEAIALYHMAKQHYKKCDEFVTALYEHFNVDEDDRADIDFWESVIEDESFIEMNKDRIRWTKDLQKKKKTSGAKK